MPHHDRTRFVSHGLAGSYQRKYTGEPRFHFAVDYLSELTIRIADELARQPVANIAAAVESVMNAETEPGVRAWIARLAAGGPGLPPAGQIFGGPR